MNRNIYYLYFSAIFLMLLGCAGTQDKIKMSPEAYSWRDTKHLILTDFKEGKSLKGDAVIKEFPIISFNNKLNKVTLACGSKDGIQKGFILSVFNPTGKNSVTYNCKVEVLKLNKYTCVCRIIGEKNMDIEEGSSAEYFEWIVEPQEIKTKDSSEAIELK